ncbi:MAG TPA: tetratricopeptide repeat protein [Candidatus Saccharimonadales bacterium]|nr:tetratricopeptide repeat protein [Candidatus Saccharimonadales bacterium]
MYELILIIAFGFIVFRAYNLDNNHEDDIPHKISNKVGKLWDVVHQGMRENRLLKAEKALLTILKIDERNAAAYNRLGILYARQKEYKDAIDCFEVACSIESSASALHNLGLIYLETENYEKSATAFEEALRLDENLASRHIALAKVLEHLGHDKKIIEHLEKAKDIEPTRDNYRLLIAAYRKHGQQQKADLLEDKIKRLIEKKTKKNRFAVRKNKRVIA